MKNNFIYLSILMVALTACDQADDWISQSSMNNLENEIIKDVEETADEELHKDLDKRKKQ